MTAGRSGPMAVPATGDGIRLAFLIGAIYDGVLGLIFLLAPRAIMTVLGIPFPENAIYLQLAAGLIALMGLLHYFVWRDRVSNADIITVLVVFKVFYVLLTILSASQGRLPHPLFGVFAVIDLLFFLVFLGALRAVGRSPRGTA